MRATIQSVPTHLDPESAFQIASYLQADEPAEDGWYYKVFWPVGAKYALVKVIDEEGEEVGYL